MSLDSAIIAASSGLANVSRHLAVVSQNVANAGTAGYVAETASDAALTAAGIGYGVRTGLMVRTVDLALQAAYGKQLGDTAGAAVRQNALSQVAAVQGAPGAGNDLASQLGKLADAFTALGADPGNQTQQAAVVGAAQTLAAGITAQAAGYADARQAAQDSLVTDVAALNAALHDIGTLSDQIVGMRSGGQSSADLESQRDAKQQAAAKLAGLSFIPQANGDVLAVAGGLVVDTHAGTGPFAIAGAGLGAGSVAPGLTLSGVDVTQAVAGGSIGANLALRDAVLPSAQAGLDEFAHTLAIRLDSQGLRLFTGSGGALPPGGGTPAQAGYVGFAGTVRVNPAVVAAPTLVRDGTHAVAGDPAGATAFTPNPPGGPAGFSTLIGRVLGYAFGSQAQAGVPQPAPATTGLGADGTLSLGYGAGTTLAAFAANLVGAQSRAAADASGALDTAQALQSTLQAKVQSVFGVSVDAELSTMIALQNAYGANAKVITAAQSMWSALLAAVVP